MGSKFFANRAPAVAMPGNINAENRAISSGAYAGRQSAGNAQKDLAGLIQAYKSHGFKPMKNGAAYPKGPKL